MGWSKPLSPLGASPSQLVAGPSSLDVPAAHGHMAGTSPRLPWSRPSYSTMAASVSVRSTLCPCQRRNRPAGARQIAAVPRLRMPARTARARRT